MLRGRSARVATTFCNYSACGGRTARSSLHFSTCDLGMSSIAAEARARARGLRSPRGVAGRVEGLGSVERHGAKWRVVSLGPSPAP